MSGGYTVYTDGACRGNPGPGGWGVVVRAADGSERELAGGAADTTNNRMELTAAIMALEGIPEGSPVVLWTDSKYLRNGITSWIAAWRRNDWYKANRQPVKNRDLWTRLDAAAGRCEVDWKWVRGHAGHPENERADALARQGLEDGLGGGQRQRTGIADRRADRGVPGPLRGASRGGADGGGKSAVPAVGGGARGGGSYTVYTDGACSGNPGPGGWGVVVRAADGSERELAGDAADTTNNRMELTAAIMALEGIPEGSRVVLWTDSKYLQDGITSWIAAWRRNGWRTASRQPVKNRDLWTRLDAAADRCAVDWKWVRGRAGHPENERADALARQGLGEIQDG